MERLLESYSQIFANAPIGIYVEQDRRFVYVNPTFLSSTLFTVDDLVGKRPLSFVLPRERKHVKAEVIRMLKGTHRVPFEFRVRIKNGETRWIMQTVAPVQYKGNRAIVAFYMDVTELKRKDQELAHSRERLRNLTIHLQNIREQERTKIAREIHDELGQILTALKLDVSSLIKMSQGDQLQKTNLAKSTMELLDTAIRSVQKISAELRPSILTHLGLEAAIEWEANEFVKRTGITCETSVPQESLIKNSDLSTALFRIFQEALTNVARHARATQVNVGLKKKNGVIKLQVSDNGKGIKQSQICSVNSLGLLGMQERARSFGGTCKITGEKGGGTRLAVSIPTGRKRV